MKSCYKKSLVRPQGMSLVPVIRRPGNSNFLGFLILGKSFALFQTQFLFCKMWILYSMNSEILFSSKVLSFNRFLVNQITFECTGKVCHLKENSMMTGKCFVMANPPCWFWLINVSIQKSSLFTARTPMSLSHECLKWEVRCSNTICTSRPQQACSLPLARHEYTWVMQVLETNLAPFFTPGVLPGF